MVALIIEGLTKNKNARKDKRNPERMPIQDCLSLFSDHVPFKEFLVYGDRNGMEPAEYINKIKKPPDWGIIFHKDSLPESSDKGEPSAEYSLLKDFDAMRLSGKCKSILDESQLTAVELALKNKLVLIQVMTKNLYVYFN